MLRSGVQNYFYRILGETLKKGDKAEVHESGGGWKENACIYE